MLEVVFFYLFATVLTYFIYKSISHPVVFFNVLWFVLLIIYCFGDLGKRMGLYQSGDMIFQIFFVGGVCFNIGALAFSFFKPSRHVVRSEKIHEVISDKRIRVVVVAEVILLFYYIYKLYTLAGFLLSGQSYALIRSLYFSEDMITSPLESAFIIFVSDPLLLFTEIVFSINLFVKAFPKKLNYLLFINLMLKTIITGGRTTLFETGCLVIVCAIYFGYFKKIKKETIGLIVGVFVLVYVVVLVSVQRHGDEGSVLEIAANNLITYFVGSFVFFEDLLLSHDYLNQTYGLVTFGGLTDVFIQLFRYLKLTDMSLSYVSVGSILSDFRMIGDGISYNAMPTMYYYFFTDFREFGYILCPMLFGFFSVYIYNKMVYKNTLLYFAYYLFIMVLIVESSFNWQLERIPFVMAIIYSYFVFRSPRLSKKATI